ncbi:hypothetical protein [Endozoicomonas montiporae]|uniref:hypothetical protein n=1 Tax=Endozoicomonas montiporae TaxID=1027273 RepID=UPI000AC30199|nr:hypothetical protein [Endozoicomonas montiporae]
MDLSFRQHDSQLFYLPLMTLSFGLSPNTSHQKELWLFKNFLQSNLIPDSVPAESYDKLRLQIELTNTISGLSASDPTGNTSKSVTLYSSMISEQYRIVLPRTDIAPLSITPKIIEIILDHELLQLLSVSSVEQLITLLYQPPVASVASPGGGDGGDDGDNNEHFRKHFQFPDFLLFIYPEKRRPVLRITEQDIKSIRLQHKLKLLAIIRRKLKNTDDENLKKIYQDRIMVIQADYNDLISEWQTKVPLYASDPESWTPSSYAELDQLLTYYFDYFADAQSILFNKLPGSVGDLTEDPMAQQKHSSQSPEDTPSQQQNEQSGQQLSDNSDNSDNKGDFGDDKNDPPEDDSVSAVQTVDMSYSQKVEAFLAIPEEDFLRLDRQLKLELFKTSNSPSNQINRAKKTMAMAVFKWLKNRNKDEARKEFMQAYELSEVARQNIPAYRHSHVVGNPSPTVYPLSLGDGTGMSLFATSPGQQASAHPFDPDDQILAWLMIHKYKKLLDATSEDPEADALELHSYFFRSIERANPEVLPLLIMYYAGALPGINCPVNFEIYLELLLKFEDCITDYDSHYFFPVSFTTLDRIRWAPMGDTTYKSVELASMHLLQRISYYILLRYMAECTDNDFIKSSDLAKNPQSYDRFFNMIYTTSRGIKAIKENWIYDDDRAYEAICSDLNEHKNRIEKINKVPDLTEGLRILKSLHYQSLAVLVRVKIKCFNKSTKIIKTLKREVLEFHQKAADHFPELWHRVFQDAIDIGMTSEAREAARQLNYFWQERNLLLADYWQERFDSLSSQLAETVAPVPEPAEQSTTPLLLPDLPAQSQGKATATGKKNRKTRQTLQKKPYQLLSIPVSTSAQEELARGENSKADKLPETLSPTDLATLPGATIKVDRTRRNVQDSSQDGEQWQVQAATKIIRPFERIYRKNWNRQIYDTLKKVRTSREKGKPREEYNLYEKQLKGNSKSIVGIERIWEEMGWLLLHQYDGSFATQAIPENLRKEVLKITFKAKDHYFLPAIALLLGLDEMNSNLSPDVLSQAVRDILREEEFDSDDQKNELIHRFRCLSSSVAHSFSLAAMASPRNRKLKVLAEQWYKTKNDLIALKTQNAVNAK